MTREKKIPLAARIFGPPKQKGDKQKTKKPKEPKEPKKAKEPKRPKAPDSADKPKSGLFGKKPKKNTAPPKD